jgi:uncharacterized protein YuzE
MSSSRELIQVTFELSRENGYLAIYARFRQGRPHTTVEVTSELSADVDREGRLLGIEIIRTFSTKARKVRLSGIVDFRQVQRAVEKHFGCSLEEEFGEIREAAAALSS